MIPNAETFAPDRAFFNALIASDTKKLRDLLTDDFLLIDVMSGSEVPGQAFVEFVGSGEVTFRSIEPAEVKIRTYGQTTVVTGRTMMEGSFSGTPFIVKSRYTHIFVDNGSGWKMASAQGTPIQE